MSSSSPSPSFLGCKGAAAAAATTDRPGKVPRTRAATWSHRETLDFLALWGEEGIQAQLNRCHRNADVYQWISERMAERGYSRDEDQCRTKGKDLKKSYKQAKLQEDGGIARQRCRFFHELDAILGGGKVGIGRGGGGGGGGGRNSSIPKDPNGAGPWCQVVIKEESDPELDPDQEHQEEEEEGYTWTQVSVTDGSDLDAPQCEPSAHPPSATASSSSSSFSSSQTVGGLVPPEDQYQHPHHPHHHHVPGGMVKEEEEEVEEEGEEEEEGRLQDDSLHRDGSHGGSYLYAQENAHGETPRGEILGSQVVEEAGRHCPEVEAPWRPPVSRRGE